MCTEYGLIHNSVTDSSDPGVPSGTGEQLISCGSCPFEQGLHIPPSTSPPQGAFFPPGAAVAGAAVMQDPHSSALCLSCCARCGFLSVQVPECFSQPKQFCDAETVDAAGQGGGTAWSWAVEMLQGAGEAQGCARPGEGDRDSAGTHLG